MPRGNRWVFGCGAGIADGPLEAWNEAREAARLGIPSLPKFSWRGFWATARARVAVVAFGFGDVNPYAVTGAFVAQLWHGIPLKRIGLDAVEVSRSSFLPNSRLVRGLLRWMYRRSAQRIGVIPAASHLVRGRLESAFGLSHDRVAVVGEPRVDVLSRGDAASRRASASELVASLVPDLTQDRRLVLYAPTWRNGDPDPGVPSPGEWARLLDVLERHDAALVVRSHRLGEGEYRPPTATDRVAMLGVGLLADVNRALPAFDAIITDYSSLAYDSSLVPLPAFFLAPDLDDYARRRGFYGVYGDVAGEDVARSWGELIPELDEALGDAGALARRTERARELSARVHDFDDGNNTRRVIDEVFARIGKARG